MDGFQMAPALADFRLVRATEERALRLRLTGPAGPRRAHLERFVRMVFKRAYGANVRHFMPNLLSLHDHDDRVLAVCGMRRAEDGPLFLEHYLAQPVESMLEARIGKPVPRDSIVEVGNLAVTELGLARTLLREVIHHLVSGGTEWGVFTATPSMRNSLGKLSVGMEVLGDASLSQVPADEQPDWGNYYDQAPQVMAVRHLAC
jgi:hypothetical protein